jgi:hypothetical protein
VNSSVRHHKDENLTEHPQRLLVNFEICERSNGWSSDLVIGGALENLSPANLLPRVNWYLLSLLQLRIRFNGELMPISDTLPTRSLTAPISISSIVRSPLKPSLVH